MIDKAHISRNETPMPNNTLRVALFLLTHDKTPKSRIKIGMADAYLMPEE